MRQSTDRIQLLAATPQYVWREESVTHYASDCLATCRPSSSISTFDLFVTLLGALWMMMKGSKEGGTREQCLLSNSVMWDRQDDWYPAMRRRSIFATVSLHWFVPHMPGGEINYDTNADLQSFAWLDDNWLIVFFLNRPLGHRTKSICTVRCSNGGRWQDCCFIVLWWMIRGKVHSTRPQEGLGWHFAALWPSHDIILIASQINEAWQVSCLSALLLPFLCRHTVTEVAFERVTICRININ